MSADEFGSIALTLGVYVAAVHGLGYLAERLRQPRLVGEILAGVLAGPFVLEALAPSTFTMLFGASGKTDVVLGFLYQLGLILLMFCAGGEARGCLPGRICARPARSSVSPTWSTSGWSSGWDSPASCRWPR